MLQFSIALQVAMLKGARAQVLRFGAAYQKRTITKADGESCNLKLASARINVAPFQLVAPFFPCIVDVPHVQVWAQSQIVLSCIHFEWFFGELVPGWSPFWLSFIPSEGLRKRWRG